MSNLSLIVLWVRELVDFWYTGTVHHRTISLLPHRQHTHIDSALHLQQNLQEFLLLYTVCSRICDNVPLQQQGQQSKYFRVHFFCWLHCGSCHRHAIQHTELEIRLYFCSFRYLLVALQKTHILSYTLDVAGSFLDDFLGQKVCLCLLSTFGNYGVKKFLYCENAATFSMVLNLWYLTLFQALRYVQKWRMLPDLCSSEQRLPWIQDLYGHRGESVFIRAMNCTVCPCPHLWQRSIFISLIGSIMCGWVDHISLVIWK